jgi:hypothetical protein
MLSETKCSRGLVEFVTVQQRRCMVRRVAQCRSYVRCDVDRIIQILSGTVGTFERQERRTETTTQHCAGMALAKDLCSEHCAQVGKPAGS